MRKGNSQIHQWTARHRLFPPLYLSLSLPRRMMSCDYTHKYAIRLSTRRRKRAERWSISFFAVASLLFRCVRTATSPPPPPFTPPDTHTHLQFNVGNNGNNNANWWSVKDFRQLPAEDCPAWHVCVRGRGRGAAEAGAECQYAAQMPLPCAPTGGVAQAGSAFRPEIWQP